MSFLIEEERRACCLAVCVVRAAEKADACCLLYRGRGWKSWVTVPVVGCTEDVDGDRGLPCLLSIVQRTWMEVMGFRACCRLYRGRGWRSWVTVPVVGCTEDVDGDRGLFCLLSVVQRTWMEIVGYHACCLLYRGRGWKAVTMPVVCCTEGVDGERGLPVWSPTSRPASHHRTGLWCESRAFPAYHVALLAVVVCWDDDSIEGYPPKLPVSFLSYFLSFPDSLPHKTDYRRRRLARYRLVWMSVSTNRFFVPAKASVRMI